ncbi:glycoside hydrolase family 127 protein [Mucilaginibacter gynuensis]|uniref:Glycoside hydrolase family 127 protein n=1 Tax=Mucilaginibacter gynuensis TaxID=1302236 RepID=A0ABP8GEN8_9SPHI
MKKALLILSALPAVLFALANTANAQSQHTITPLNLRQVKIDDSFWSPKLDVWRKQTVYDVLDKLEGKYEPDREDLIKEKAERGSTRNAFKNFDLVAEGKKNIGTSDGPPWYDGLVYETIRGAADLLIAYPDKQLEQKIDGYIKRIAAAQAADPDGYINTYTTLNKPNQRWGTNGGDDRWQHDVYNAGMLAEAGIHYYQATGKTTLLTVAVKMANYMCKVMGDAPKLNIVPAHAGPEEAFFKMYLLFKTKPALATSLKTPVKADDYYKLVTYWIEHRGNYKDADGGRERASYGSYDQDQSSVFEQKTIEGHAVRATLLGTAIATIANYNHDARYAETANNYWNNMIGKRLFITGGQGAIANDEKFGDDYYLPESAYLETCAAIGAGFFSERMNELQADGKYMDEFERVLYNNILSGVSLDGQHYHYENPLITDKHPRWVWHSCPCCPPMFLKMMGALPSFIYGKDNNGIYVNLFIGSTANVALGKNNVSIKQTTAYPFNGKIQLQVSGTQAKAFNLNIRIPGWAQGNENPFGLYSSTKAGTVKLTINGKQVPLNIVKGYASVNRAWKKTDQITLELPMQPRVVSPRTEVATLKNKVALASGPLVYALETTDNTDLNAYSFSNATTFKPTYDAKLLGGTQIIVGSNNGNTKTFTAIPFYTLGNRGTSAYKVWVSNDKQD